MESIIVSHCKNEKIVLLLRNENEFITLQDRQLYFLNNIIFQQITSWPVMDISITINKLIEGKYVKIVGNNTMLEGYYSKGKKEGPWIIRWGNHEKQAEGRYVNNEREGKWTFWHKNGNKNRQKTVGIVSPVY